MRLVVQACCCGLAIWLSMRAGAQEKAAVPLGATAPPQPGLLNIADSFVVPFAPGRSNRMAPLAPKPKLSPRFNQSATNTFRAATLKPGVYETRPYSCIVVVPGPNPDDKGMIIGGKGVSGSGKTEAPMPMQIPNLEFIPRQRK